MSWTRAFRRGSTSTPPEEGQGVYRRAIEYILETAHRQAKSETGSAGPMSSPGGDRRPGQGQPVRGARWEEVLPTRRFEVKGFRHQAGQGGIGAPVVAASDPVRATGEKPRPRPPAP